MIKQTLFSCRFVVFNFVVEWENTERKTMYNFTTKFHNQQEGTDTYVLFVCDRSIFPVKYFLQRFIIKYS